MSKNYIATVMERDYLRTNTFSFKFSHVVLGEYDEEKKLFTDEYGRKYFYMLSDPGIADDNTKSVYHIMKIDELKKTGKDKDKPLDILISRYSKKMEEKAYIVGYTKDDKPYIRIINLEEIQKEENNIHKNVDSEEDAPTSVQQLNQIIQDVVEGEKYSKEDLEGMLDRLYLYDDTLQNTIATVENQLDAMAENKSYREYLDEQLEKDKEPPKKDAPKLPSSKDIKAKQDQLKEDLKKKHNVGVAKDTNKVVVKKDDRINIDEVFNNVTKTLIAQDKPARRVIVELARKEMDPRKKREGILLTGPTGVGKTELMRLIAQNINRPFFRVDSTQLTIPGYVGTDIEEVLWDLYVQCGKNLDKAEHAIIYFDEIDKKGSEKKDDVSGQGVLNVLLPFIEGSTYNAAPDTKNSSPMVKIDTSNMTVILGGAFSDVYKHLIENNQIGFDTEKYSLDAPKYRQAETKDFVEYGMMTNEFMGRVTVIKLNDLGREEIKRVMLESDQSAIKKQEEIFAKLGVKLTYTSEYTDAVVEKAFKLKTGARGLNGIIDQSTWEAFDQVYSHKGICKEIELTAESVEDSSKYKIKK